MVGYSLAELATKLNGIVKGDDNVKVVALATLDKAESHQLSFLSNPKYIDQLKQTKAGAVLISEDALPICPTNAIVIDNPYLAFAIIGQLFDNSPKYKPGIHPRAIVAESAKVAESAYIGPNVVIGEQTVVGENVVIEANSVISDKCIIGDNCKIKANATLYHDVKLGKNCIIHSGAVLGSDGFGNARDANGNWMKVPQLGGVTCGDNVEIGSNSSVDRGAINDTVLADGVKLDNLVQVGHNVEVGENTAFAAQVGVAGSSKVGKNCLFGGQVGLTGHITVVDDVMVASKSGVAGSISKPGIYQSCWPVKPHMEWKRNVARVSMLDKTLKKLKEST